MAPSVALSVLHVQNYTALFCSTTSTQTLAPDDEEPHTCLKTQLRMYHSQRKRFRRFALALAGAKTDAS